MGRLRFLAIVAPPRDTVHLLDALAEGLVFAEATGVPPLLRLTLVGIRLGSIPRVGAWAASKRMIPWADEVGDAAEPGYKAITHGGWAIGAALGSYFAGLLFAAVGDSYFRVGSRCGRVYALGLVAIAWPSINRHTGLHHHADNPVPGETRNQARAL